jgi:hypothetical protein
MDKKVVVFVEEKVTKNTVRFQEVVGDMDQPAIGTLYVQKSGLKDIGYQTGGKLKVTLEVTE